MPPPLKESHYLLAWLLFWLATSTIGAASAASAIAIISTGSLDGLAPNRYILTLIIGLTSYLLNAIVSYLLFRFIVGATLIKKALARADT